MWGCWRELRSSASCRTPAATDGSRAIGTHLTATTAPSAHAQRARRTQPIDPWPSRASISYPGSGTGGSCPGRGTGGVPGISSSIMK